ncbi:iron transporter [Polycladidibacter stylochi]|uniref:iron transporter n=1 Tax=Polycladidibacter stylochi TaxID=1807766 RepID=UPI00082B8206|nr:iron transporter [Pseudovibrio stylochi]
MKKVLAGTVAIVGLCAANAALAQEFKEYPIGDAQTVAGMEIAAVYLSPVDMEPRGMGLPSSQSDIHLEADIHAVKGNVNGFGAGEWIPYLSISYRLENVDTGKIQTGNFMPMIAVDGPHYGANIKMPGAGNYKLSYHIENPMKQGLMRHTDKVSGVGKWFQPVDVDYDFTYVPLK